MTQKDSELHCLHQAYISISNYQLFCPELHLSLRGSTKARGNLIRLGKKSELVQKVAGHDFKSRKSFLDHF